MFSNLSGQNKRSDEHFFQETLYYANWKAPIDFGKDGGHCPTPPSVLLAVRRVFTDHYAPAKTPKTREALVYIKRKKGDMRSVLQGEDDFVKELQRWTKSVSLEFVTFDGLLKPKATALLFNRASIILGFHGGALANLLFAPPNCHIFELGTASPYAGHYRYLSEVFGLRWSRLALQSSKQGLAAVEAALEDQEKALEEIKRTGLGKEEL